MSDRILYGYWRSSAAYRVRIALNLKGLDYDQKSIDLKTGAQQSPGYKMLNPHGRVPFLIDGEVGLNQSPAILEYLDETYTEPSLLPGDAALRGRIRAAAAIIACDVHPLGNSSVLQYLKTEYGQEHEGLEAWYGHWVATGFRPLEELAENSRGPYLFGGNVTLADICLVPQMYNARRWRVDLDPYPSLVKIDRNLMELKAFHDARPSAQPDAEE